MCRLCRNRRPPVTFTTGVTDKSRATVRNFAAFVYETNDAVQDGACIGGPLHEDEEDGKFVRRERDHEETMDVNQPFWYQEGIAHHSR